ncbi:MAG: thioesterase family protein [Gammaproteobacteria bacterium]|nr:thioesterase family protein [Gammaproteobacteria bacterium]NVK88010.1 thioesterase family protein [Gammaproteobacteria bacterium]
MSAIDVILNNLQTEQPIQLDASWRQGRTLFGGLSAAMVYQATRNDLADPTVPLRVMNVSFIAPVFTDKPVTLTVEHLRDGKNVTQMQARMQQDDHTCVLAQFCFGRSRDSKIVVDKSPQSPLQPLSKPDFLPPIPGVTPKFLQHLQLSTQKGQLPFTGSQDSDISGWMRFKKAPAKMTLAHMIALLDAWPPTVLQMLRWPKPASTLSWQVEFLSSEISLPPDSWLGYEAITRQARNGYSHTEANIWSPSGELLMLSRQTDTVFDR